jgi:glycyl-tRNA synthetase beta chain
MRAAGVSFRAVAQDGDGKGEYFVARREKAGENSRRMLAGIVAQALKKLPIPKVMRWGDSEHQFVRPVHGLILLHGERIVPGEVLGLAAGARRSATASCRGDIVIGSGRMNTSQAGSQGKVIASFAERRRRSPRSSKRPQGELGARINPADGLLDEVTALVEWPVSMSASSNPNSSKCRRSA